METDRKAKADAGAAARRATEKQTLEDADHLITVWNERQARPIPILVSPTIGAAITAGYWSLRARCPRRCRADPAGQRPQVDVALGAAGAGTWHSPSPKR
jgi:hypothetical protein